MVYCRNVQLMPTSFLKLTGKRQIRRFQRPHAGLKTSQQEIPSNDLNCQKLELLIYIFAADSMGLRSLIFT